MANPIARNWCAIGWPPSRFARPPADGTPSIRFSDRRSAIVIAVNSSHALLHERRTGRADSNIGFVASVIVALLVRAGSMLPQHAARQERIQNLPAVLGKFRRLPHCQRPRPRQLDVD